MSRTALFGKVSPLARRRRRLLLPTLVAPSTHFLCTAPPPNPCLLARDPGLLRRPSSLSFAPPAMATEQPSKKKPPPPKKKPPPPKKKAPLPKVVTLNKALKLAQTWVDKMSAVEPDEPNDKDFEGRPSRLGLGAKVAHNAKRAAPSDPVERRLLGKVNAQKRKLEEENKTAQEVNDASDDDSGEPEGRTSACSKKRALPSVTSMPLGKKAK